MTQIIERTRLISVKPILVALSSSCGSRTAPNQAPTASRLLALVADEVVCQDAEEQGFMTVSRHRDLLAHPRKRDQSQTWL
jgi:hypothetical protein